MYRREIREGALGWKERQDTDRLREIGSVDKGRRTVGCCTDLGCRPPNIERMNEMKMSVFRPLSSFRFRDRRYSVGDQPKRTFYIGYFPPDPSTNHTFVLNARHKGTAARSFKRAVRLQNGR